MRGATQPGDDQLATRGGRTKPQLGDLADGWEPKAPSEEAGMMIIKIATKLPMPISITDASIHHLQSSSNLPERRHHPRATDAKAEGPRNPEGQGLAASRVKLTSITPGCVPIHAKCVHSFSQPARQYQRTAELAAENHKICPYVSENAAFF